MTENKTLTPKAQRTRQRIFDTAIELFVQKGYEETTMIDIAQGADCSPGLAYRYFSGKDALVLELWTHLATDFVIQLDEIDNGSWVDRYYQAMQIKIRQLQPYRDVIQATIGAAMNPDSGVAIIGNETTDYRDITLSGFESLIADSKDAPKELRIQQLAILMYGIHLVTILVWIYDRTPSQRVTESTLSFMHDTAKLLRPIMILPPVSNSLTRLAKIMEGIFVPDSKR